jgi:alpha-tubulin suppressor-like RCC1 family protein
VAIRDAEGNTAIDLYNSTVNYTKPSAMDPRPHAGSKRPTPPTELYTWGANRNATLGLGDGNDRVHPEHVQLHPILKTESSSQLPSNITQVGMSKLHTAAVTDDSTNNVRLCGFGLGGRLGQTQHTQFDFVSIQTPQKIIKVALGQDHTLALTESWEVVSWGLNRFSQLGYAVESADLTQPTARKIAGPLRGEMIEGIAACKTASVCWSVGGLFAWGTNNGQFGVSVGRVRQLHPDRLPHRLEKRT